jgi:chaperonin GroES
MKLKPLGDRVVVKASEAEEQTKSGLFIPDTAKEKPQKGKVVAVGEGRWDEDGERRIPLDVKVGDLVIYGKYSAQEFKVDGDELLILRADDIYAIVEGK